MLRMMSISKRYGAAVALEEASLEVAAGQVMALLGENGAGKSTLMKILCGLIAADGGQIEIDGKATVLGSVQRARAAGIGYVAQELSIIETMSAAENIFLGDASVGWLRPPSKLEAMARGYLERVGLSHIDPATPAGSLTVGERQLVEIARLLSRKAKIAILDEPTAALADGEIAQVEKAVKTLADHGAAVVYVTHRLREVYRLCHAVTVLRNARSFPAVPTETMTVDQLIEKMLGRPLDHMFPPRGSEKGEAVLALKGCLGAGLQVPVDLTIRRGEIVALAGQVGSGASSVLRIIGGHQRQDAGEMTIRGEAFHPTSVRDAIAKGVTYCSGDRKRDGIFAGLSVTNNLSAPSLKTVTPLGLTNRSLERAFSLGLAQRFEVAERHMDRATGDLSGGNQQKVALGKWIGTAPRVLLVEEPTRGVDVGARAEIYAQLRKLANDGVAIVFASSDSQEVLGLADTVVTFYHGRTVRTVDAATALPEDITRDLTHPEGHAPAPERFANAHH